MAGAGLISSMHLAFLAASSIDAAVVAVHDPDADRGDRFAARTGATVMDLDGMLDAVDALYVTAWTAAHPELVTAAAERGVAVFCEKPVAFTAPLVADMVATVERAGIVNAVGLVLRSVPAWVLVRRLLADDRAGRLLAVSFRDDQYIPNQGRYASTWRVDPALAGRGALLEHSIHDVDVLGWVGGEVGAVSGAVREVHGHERIDDVAVARLEFAGGAIASLTSVWHDILERPSMRHIELFTERLYVSLDGGSAGTVRWQFTGGLPEEATGDALVAACLGSPDVATADVVTFLGGPIFNPATPFLAAVRDGAPAPLPLAAALPAHRIVDAIYASADDGGRVVSLDRAGGAPEQTAVRREAG
jgi:predicted dehydrogenase